MGFGRYHYKYASGPEGDWFLTGFSPRKQNLTLYIVSGFERYDEILKNLGKFKIRKSCLYINKLEDINIPKLKELLIKSVKHLKRIENKLFLDILSNFIILILIRPKLIFIRY